MTKLLRPVVLALAAPLLMVSAGAQSPVGAAPKLSVDVLSDAQGADLSPWMRQMVASVRAHWSIGEVAPQGDAQIAITVAPDGRLLAMQLENARPDEVFDRAAWGATHDALTSSARPLPIGFKGENLKLRLHFTE